MKKNYCFFAFILLFSQLTYSAATSSSGGTPIFVAPTRSKEMLGRDINALSQLLQLARQPERAGAQKTLCARKQLLSQLQQEQARSQQREEKRKQNNLLLLLSRRLQQPTKQTQIRNDLSKTAENKQ